MAPRADERAIVEQGGLSDLRQRFHYIVDIHVAQKHARAECALQLLDAPVDVRRFQQMVPASTNRFRRASSRC